METTEQKDFSQGGNHLTTLQNKIIQEMGVQPEINAEVEIRKTVDFMKDYLKAHPFLKTLVLGISGGQDSTLLGKLAQITAKEMREETGETNYQFIAMRLPYGKQGDAEDVENVLEWMAPDQVITVNIQSAVDALEKEFQKESFELSDFNKGNVKARQRMIAQFAVAGDTNGIVIGTDHPAESISGFFTKFGDGAADIMPLYRLNKRQGAQLLKALDSPAYFYEKVPTADLRDDKPGMSDEEELGVSYDHIDDYLEGKKVPEDAKDRIEELYLNSRHKRHLPITIFDEFWKE